MALGMLKLTSRMIATVCEEVVRGGRCVFEAGRGVVRGRVEWRGGKVNQAVFRRDEGDEEGLRRQSRAQTRRRRGWRRWGEVLGGGG